jgi:hypothetical protein
MRPPSGVWLCLLIVVLAFAVAGCGDDGDTTTSTSPATTGGVIDARASGGAEGSGKEDDHRGGEASIQDFGSEASGSDRDEVVAAFRGQLDALARGDFAAACTHLSEQAKEGLEAYGNTSGKAPCAKLLSVLAAPTASDFAREQVGGRITKVRVGDDKAFVLFRAPGAKLYMLAFVREDGEWKGTMAFASVLVPDL